MRTAISGTKRNQERGKERQIAYQYAKYGNMQYATKSELQTNACEAGLNGFGVCRLGLCEVMRNRSGEKSMHKHGRTWQGHMHAL